MLTTFVFIGFIGFIVLMSMALPSSSSLPMALPSLSSLAFPSSSSLPLASSFKSEQEYLEWISNKESEFCSQLALTMCTICDESPEALKHLLHVLKHKILKEKCLYSAIQLNKLKIIRYLIDEKAVEPSSLRVAACEMDNLAYFQLFLEYQQKDCHGLWNYTAYVLEWVLTACQYSSFKILSYLLEQSYTNTQHARLALNYMCYRKVTNKSSLMMLLIQHGADNLDALSREKDLLVELLDLGLNPSTLVNQKSLISIFQTHQQRVNCVKTTLSFLPSDVIEHCVGPYVNYTII
jgi:hypothetical protein